MMAMRLASGLILAGLVVGCATKPKEQAIVVPDATTVLQVKSGIQQMDPNARVGQINEVNTDDNTAAVGDIDTTGIKEGDVVTFLDGNQTPLTTGKVIRVLEGAIHVHFDAPLPSGRAPVVGDLAVRFTK